MTTNYKNANRNSFYNILGVAFPLLAALISIPYLNKNLSADDFSMIFIAWAIIGYFSFFDFGVGRALTFSISEINPSNRGLISSYLISGFFVILLTSVFGSFMVFLFGKYAVGNWYDLNIKNIESSQLAIYICAITVFPTTITAGLRGALEGLNKYLYSNINRTILGCGMFLAPLLAVEFYGASIVAIAYSLLIVRIVVMLLAFFQIKKYLFIKPSQNIVKTIKKIFNYGIWVTLSGLVGPLLMYGDRFILGGIVEFSDIGPYATIQELLLKLIVIPGAISGALFYEFSAIKQNYESIKIMSQKYNLYIAIIMMIIIAMIALIGKSVLTIWVSDDFAQSTYYILLIMSIGIFFNSISMVPHTILSATDNVKFIGILHLIETIIMIPILFYFANQYGLIGAACVWSGRTIIDFIFLKSQSIRVLKNSKYI